MEHIERVRAFLKRRSEQRGVDPDMIYGLDGNQYVLTVTDLTALCDDAARWQRHLRLQPDVL